MIAAVDIGGTKLAVGMVDEQGRVLAKREAPTGPASRYSNGLASILDMLRQVSKDADAEISGIGIGSTGPVNPFTGEFCELDALPGWHNVKPVHDLSSAFQVPVALENDADAGALAEAAWGAGRHCSRMIYVTVGTGIGGGIVIDGQLYRGAGGVHPEVAHQVIEASGPKCSCGLHGCWEVLTSGPAIATWYNSQAARQQQAPASAEQVFRRAAENDDTARRAVERAAYYLGLGCASLINLFAPDVIVLGGGVMKSGSLLLPRIRETVDMGCRFVPFDSKNLVLAALGDDVNLIGAARVWYHRFNQQRESCSVRI